MLYDAAYLRFYFDDEPELQLRIEILAHVSECTFETVDFSEKIISVVQVLGEEASTVQLPELVTAPVCNRKPVLGDFELKLEDTPLGGLPLDSLVSFDSEQRSLTV